MATDLCTFVRLVPLRVPTRRNLFSWQVKETLGVFVGSQIYSIIILELRHCTDPPFIDKPLICNTTRRGRSAYSITLGLPLLVLQYSVVLRAHTSDLARFSRGQWLDFSPHHNHPPALRLPRVLSTDKKNISEMQKWAHRESSPACPPFHCLRGGGARNRLVKKVAHPVSQGAQ